VVDAKKVMPSAFLLVSIRKGIWHVKLHAKALVKYQWGTRIYLENWSSFLITPVSVEIKPLFIG